jgi:hypothetical protein
MALDTGVDPIRMFLGTALTEARKLILQDSEHQRLSVRHARMNDDHWRITVMCMVCERKWTTSFTPDQIVSSLPDMAEKEIVRRWIAPLVDVICRTSCFEIVEAALLAEWLTRRLVAAGAKGMPYVQVIHDAVEARLCSPRDVDQILRQLEFVPEWVKLGSAGVILPGGWDGAWTLPILHLPDGHPLKTW